MKSALLKVSLTLLIGVLLAVLISSTSLARISSAASVHSPGTLTPRVWLPIVMNNFPPAPTISHYITTTSWSILNGMGCNEAIESSSSQDIVSVLDFGYSGYDAGSGQYGIYLLTDPYTFRSISEVFYATQGYMTGFYNCLPAGSLTHLTVAIGVNNSSAGVTNGHGVAWGQMVNSLNTWLAIPPSYTSTLTAWGAIDAEPPWNSAAVTRAWVDGYASVYNAQLKSNYLNFGSCDGCAYSGCPACIPTTTWTIDDIWYVSWGAVPAYPLPEIYLTNGINADQWYRMSLYAYTNHGQLMKFKGSLTQWNACQEQTDPNGCNDIGTDNTQGDGYLQLYDAINADSRTAWAMPWSTDMSWKK